MIILLLFGGKKLPDLARSIGNGINEFKKGLSGSADVTTTSQPYQAPERDITEQANQAAYLPAPEVKSKPRKTASKAAVKKPVKTAAKAKGSKTRKA